jgi:hypothetical protein
MATALVTARTPEVEEVARPARVPRETTLEDAIAGAWEDLLGRGLTRCPVCSASSMELVPPDDRSEGERGSCERCGSKLV